MDLEQFLTNQRESMIQRWTEGVFSLYPMEAQPLLKKKKSPFLNPLAHTLASSIVGLYDELIGDTDPEKLAPHLEAVIKAISLQGGLPSTSLSFMFVFKRTLKAALVEAELFAQLRDEYDQAIDLIDQIIRISIDILVKTREAVYQLKVDEMERKTHSLIKLVNAQAVEAQAASEQETDEIT